MKIRKATSTEKDNYRGVHGLYGFVSVRGIFAKHEQTFDCSVEYLGEGKDEPNYEVIAPSGLHFEEGELTGRHTILGTTQRDMLDQITRLVECQGDC